MQCAGFNADSICDNTTLHNCVPWALASADSDCYSTYQEKTVSLCGGDPECKVSCCSTKVTALASQTEPGDA